MHKPYYSQYTLVIQFKLLTNSPDKLWGLSMVALDVRHMPQDLPLTMQLGNNISDL